MSWAKLDDKAHSAPSTLAAGNEAFGLWARCESYIANLELDGLVPTSVVLLFAGDKHERLSTRLIEAGLWERSEGGFRSVGYLSRNPSRADGEARRELERAKKAQWRKRKTGVSTSASTGDIGGTDRVSTGMSTGESRLSRTRPVPDPTREETEGDAPAGALTPSALLTALAAASGGKFVASRLKREQVEAVTKAIRGGLTLRDAELIGAWLNAGGDWRARKGEALDVHALLGKRDELELWPAKARAWDAAGRPRIDEPKKRSGVAPVSNFSHLAGGPGKDNQF